MHAPLRSFPNPRRRVAWTSFGLALLFVGAVFLPAALRMDMMDAGFGIAFLCGAAAVALFITSAVYLRLARQLDALFSGETLIAAWRMAPRTWEEFLKQEFTEERREKRVLWLVALAVSPVCALAFYLRYPEAGILWTVGAPAALLALLGLVAAVVPRWRRRIRFRNPGWIILGTNAAWVSGIAYAWSALGCRLTSLTLLAGEPTFVELEYSSLTLLGAQGESFRFPLPLNDQAESDRIVKALQQEISRASSP